jgi:DNA replication and repair protein RecF
MALLAPALEGAKLRLSGAAQEVLGAVNPVAALKGKLERSRDIDTRLERTSAGPNTLDVVAELDMNNAWVVAKQSSSGQHKRVLLRWLCGHVRVLKAQGIVPMVLVDELGAHLDAEGKAHALDALAGLGVQIWVTDVAMEAHDAVRVVGV